MKRNHLSVKSMCLLIVGGELLSMLAIMMMFAVLFKHERVLLVGAALTLCALFWLLLLVRCFEKRLSGFTSELCRTLWMA